MKKYAFSVAALAVMLVPSPAHAAYGHSTATTITEVTVLHDGSFYLTVAHDVCPSASNRRIAYSYNGVAVNGSVPTQEGRDRLLKAATAAYLSGTAVQVYTDDPPTGTWGCFLGAIKLK